MAGSARALSRIALGARQAQRLLDLLGRRLAPAAVGGLIAYLHTGRAGCALLLGAAMVAEARIVERSTFPLGLMPAARIVLGAAGPLLASIAILLITWAAGSPVPVTELEAPVSGPGS